MKRIIGIGNALVDIITYIDNDAVLGKLGLPKGSMQLVDASKSRSVKDATAHYPRSKASGGSVANTIHGIAMLGGNAGFIGSIGKDDTGDFFEKDMKDAGAATFLLRRDTETGTAAAFITPDSERTFATHLGAATDLSAGDLKAEYLDDAEILYVEGYLIINKTLVESVCSMAKEKGIKIAIDLASYNVVESNLGAFREIVSKYADIVFANEEEAKVYTGKEPEEAVAALAEQCEVAIVKTGKDGSLVKSGEEMLHVGTMKVNCIDTTGAGDLYASGFLYGIAKGFSLEDCALLGTLLAGNVITITGARMDAAMWKRIRRNKLLQK